jgi:ABC-2 type transport system permease protein
MRLGWPSPAILITTLAWLLFALPANLAAGDVLSITMAYRVNLGRLGRQSGSQGNAILSMLIQTSLLGIGAAVISLSAFFGKPWASVPVLLMFAAVAVFVWLRVLRLSDDMANRRRDTLISRLAKAE